MKKCKNHQRPRREYRFDIVDHKKAWKIWWDSTFNDEPINWRAHDSYHENMNWLFSLFRVNTGKNSCHSISGRFATEMRRETGICERTTYCMCASWRKRLRNLSLHGKSQMHLIISGTHFERQKLPPYLWLFSKFSPEPVLRVTFYKIGVLVSNKPNLWPLNILCLCTPTLCISLLSPITVTCQKRQQQRRLCS